MDADIGDDDTGRLVRALLAGRDAVPCESAPDWVATWRAIEGTTHEGPSPASPPASTVSSGSTSSPPSTAPEASPAPLDRALLASTRADRLAWAFLCAYQAAIRDAFAPDAPRGELGSFAANEAGRRMTDIETRLVRDGGRLRLEGAKSWVLRAADPFAIHVLARAADGPPGGPGSLVVVTVRSDAPGVSLQPGRPQSIVPELPHAAARFEGVPVDAAHVLAGDGYADHARPFRLAEDLCLAACALAWLLGEAARHGGSGDWRQRALAAVVLLRRCYALRSADPSIELLAAGALSLAADVIAGSDVPGSGIDWTEAARARWLRDRPLLSGAAGLRAERARSAWRRLGDGR